MKKTLTIYLLTISFFPVFANQSKCITEGLCQNSNTKSILECQEDSNEEEDFWLTGPLLASSATTTEVGTVVVAPYLIYYQTYGLYNRSWDLEKIATLNTINPFCLIQTGLTDSLDLTFYFQAFD